MVWSRVLNFRPGAPAFLLFSLALAAGSSGCVRDLDYQTISGEALYQARCATCHGQLGDGDGPAARGLQPLPRSLSAASWQDAVTDDHLRTTIVHGGASVGRTSRMPPQPDLASHPDALERLVKHVRALKRTK